jgi:Domain of unknown function (DUF4062)
LKVFLSSTFMDLVEEREAVLLALRKRRMSTLAMEDFLASPTTPLNTALANLRNSDLMILLIGSKAGSLLPDGSGRSYTSAEYDELMRLGKEALVFLKEYRRCPWSRRVKWHNAEKDPYRKKTLEDFRARVASRWTWDTFSTPDQLALAVIQAIDQWEARGRSGARRTFASFAEYFAGKGPATGSPLLDFGTTLLGREDQMRTLRAFSEDVSQRVCILSGRGGIGKSKILYDWSNFNARTTMFLKDEPLWHEDSIKELPLDTATVVVDDAHRQESFGRVLQILTDLPSHRKIKLVVSTRPGSTTRLTQHILRKFDASLVVHLPELRELSIKESRALAEQVLGPEFQMYADHLAQIASNSPLVIVAGGRLIAARRVDPSALTSLDEFRSTVFNRVLDEMDLRGPKFEIDPPNPVLHLVAALGPIDLERGEIQRSAQILLDKPIDQILATIDALASIGIVTPRGRPVRIVPDVLSDYILEDRCIGSGRRSTNYADRVYEYFGNHSLQGLMRNLAELDWRRGLSGESGLNLLDGIWADLHRRFRAGDEYERHQLLSDLSGAAIYQPNHVVSLVRTAIDDPIPANVSDETSLYRAGQDYVLSALPNLLEATAHHPDWLRESVTFLWKLAKQPSDHGNGAVGAQSVIKRLASWRRFGNPALNFGMLLQAVRLAQRPDAFTGKYTPYVIIEEILDREGEFSDWEDETSMSIGGFGLNYAAVGPIRENALDYLEFVLEDGQGRPAFLAINLLEGLLRNFLNRFGRRSTNEENEWQNRERERCLRTLVRRFERPLGALLKARIYDAVRSATAIHCPEPIREAAKSSLVQMDLNDMASVIDAICTADHELPFLTTQIDLIERQERIDALMTKGRASLERLAVNTEAQARIVIEKTRACIAAAVKVGGFRRFMLQFADRLDFLSEMYEQLLVHADIAELQSELNSVLSAIRRADPATFRQRALAALENGELPRIHAAASNLRVFENANKEDAVVIEAYARYPDSNAKQGALYAIAYMGKFTELHETLKSAALSAHANGDSRVVSGIVEAFGTYGVPLTSLTREEAASLSSEFLSVDDWDFDQGAIPRFLNSFVNVFPDETFDLLLQRIELGIRASQGRRTFVRTFGLVYGDVTFTGVPPEKRLELGSRCINSLVAASEAADEYAKLFWDVAGNDDAALRLILNMAPIMGEQGMRNIATLVKNAPPRFAFTKPAFANDLIHRFNDEQRRWIIEAFAYNVQKIGTGLYAGRFEDHMAEERKRLLQHTAAFENLPGLEDLAAAIRRFA